ncbi:hypothetical protein [Methylobacterium nigriterrae]|uniref:hypothetical protein n=1 Tax=Methylobacterium nigriterrae TaxID=3127512 RepID=UPI003013CF91
MLPGIGTALPSLGRLERECHGQEIRDRGLDPGMPLDQDAQVLEVVLQGLQREVGFLFLEDPAHRMLGCLAVRLNGIPEGTR